MTTLIEFLLARIAEDHEVASLGEPGEDDGPTHGVLEWFPMKVTGTALALGRDRALAEVEGKRQIVVRILNERGTYMDPAFDEILHALALPYADHPDYDEGWKP